MSRQIIVADDHPLFREALKAAVGRLERGIGFVEADSVAAMLAAAEANPGADLLLLDLNMPGAHGFNALAHVRGSRPELPVVIVSADDDPQTIAAALRFGAQGFIPKSTEAGQIGKAVETVLAGEIYTPPGFQPPRAPASSSEELEIARRVADLTPQQFRVLGMLCAGPAQQADRLRPRRLGSDGQGARHRDPAQARRDNAHAGRAGGRPAGDRPRQRQAAARGIRLRIVEPAARIVRQRPGPP